MMERRVKEYFNSPRKIVAVEPLEDYVLRLTFDNGEVTRYSMQDKLQGVFAILQNQAKFRKDFLDEFGNVAWDIDETVDSSLHWNNRSDLCKDALYLDSGIDAMESGHELPLEEAFQRVSELLESCRSTKR